MNTVPAKEVYKLDGAIVPQLFIKRDGDIYFFDKINSHEGRFCRLEKGKVKSVLEVGEGQGIIGHDGEIYLLKMGTETTTIYTYDIKGQMEESFDLNGIFFDFKMSETGNFVFLGYVENETIIKIINKSGIELSAFNPKQILFGSTIALCGEDIYVGGFDEKNVFKLISMNYIGGIQSQWQIEVDSEERIIGKIQRYEEHILIHIVGKYDSIVLLNADNGRIKEIKPQDLGIDNFIDINLYENQVHILDGKCIYSWTLNDILNINPCKNKHIIREKFNPILYQYLVYTRSLEKEIINSFKISIFIILFIFLYLLKTGLLKQIPKLNIMVLMLGSFWIINLTIASMKNMVLILDKSRRIDELLNIYSLKKCEKEIVFPLFMGLTLMAFSILLTYPILYILYIPLLGFMGAVFIYLVNVSATKKIIEQNKNITIELLSEDSSKFGEYLKEALDNVKDSDCMGITIEIKLGNGISTEIIEKWMRSRRYIIGAEPVSYICDNIVKMEFDLSKRDIKYSKYSIVMDFICYIEKKSQIEEMKIDFLRDKR